MKLTRTTDTPTDRQMMISLFPVSDIFYRTIKARRREENKRKLAPIKVGTDAHSQVLYTKKCTLGNCWQTDSRFSCLSILFELLTKTRSCQFSPAVSLSTLRHQNSQRRNLPQNAKWEKRHFSLDYRLKMIERWNRSSV